MHPFFEPLSKREAMLLLTTLTVGGSEATEIFRHLPRETQARLQEKAQALLQIDASKRVNFMVHEMKQALAFKGLRGVERVDATWVLRAMRGESPRIVATILVSLPGPTVRSVLKRLPPKVREQLPPKQELKQAPIELVRLVRQNFEARFCPMPPPSPKGFAYRDIVQLDKKELYTLMRDLGLIELGQAFVSVGKMALAELCRRLPRDKAEELIAAVRSASHVDLPELKSAQRFLSRVVVNFNDTEEFFQKAGLWRLAKGALLEDDTFRQAFRQRLPREAGELFISFIEKAAETTDASEDVLLRTQDSILLRIRELSARKQISPHWSELEMHFHDPQAATASPAAAGATAADEPEA